MHAKKVNARKTSTYQLQDPGSTQRSRIEPETNDPLKSAKEVVKVIPLHPIVFA